MSAEVTVEFSGLSFIHLTRMAGSDRYTGAAYLLGDAHEPRLAVPLVVVRNSDDVPPGTRTLMAPGGQLLLEADLTGKRVELIELSEPARGVEVPRWGRKEEGPQRDPTHDDDWQDLDYTLGMDTLTGVQALSPCAEALAAAIVPLDRGRLFGGMPNHPSMKAARWEVTTHNNKKWIQPVCDRVCLQIPGLDEVVIKKKDGTWVGRLVLAPEGDVPLSIYSLCDYRGTVATSLSDVVHYTRLLAGGPSVIPPRGTGPYASPNASGCPPGRLIV
jgi:hypothetical protein